MVKDTRINKRIKTNGVKKKIIIFSPEPKPETSDRIAILIIGRIKGYTYVEEQLLALQRKYNATIFCSINKKIRSPYINNFCYTFGIEDDQINLEVTPPVPTIFYNFPQSAPTSIPNAYSCSFHKERCFDLLEKYQTKYNKEFQCIIYWRADIDNKEDLVLQPVEPNTIYIPAYWNQELRNLDVDGINDQIAYGNFTTMKQYFTMINYLENMCNEYNLYLHPELCLKKYLIDQNKINVKTFPFNYNLHEGRYEFIPDYDNSQ